MSESRHTSENSLGLIIDPLHGPIQLEDGITHSTDLIRSLIKMPMLARLRGIKQLGFASYCFPAADHTRLAHALGTMQVMRRLIEKQLDSDQAHSLRASIKDVFSKDFARYETPTSLDDAISTHVYIAGLLQDVGELPFAQVTDSYFRPNVEEQRILAKKIGQKFSFSLGAKEFFTLSCISNALDEDKAIGEHLSFEFLAYLTAGVWIPARSVPNTLLSLAHMLDGVVDADRIDYVARDGLHTLGSGFVPSTVVENLMYYSERGPVFSHAEPVIAFLTAYAQLWSSVYFAPENRFRVSALAVVFQESKMALREYLDDGVSVLADRLDKGLSLKQFLQLDDRQIFTELLGLNRSPVTAKKQRLVKALSVLLELKDSPVYDAIWVSPKDALTAKDPIDFQKWLGGGVFFDAFFQVGDHTLYAKDRKPIFIHSHLFDTEEKVLPLHEIDGPFKPLLEKDKWRFGRRDSSVLVFFPSGSDARREIIEQSNNEHFYSQVTQYDPLKGDCIPDTRNFHDHAEPPIFISYESSDLRCVNSISSSLFAMKRKYYYLPAATVSGAASPKELSTSYAEQAKLALILLSESYMQKYQAGEKSGAGNIWQEVKVLLRRVESSSARVIFLTSDGFGKIKKFRDFNFPLPQLMGRDPNNFADTDIQALSHAIPNMTPSQLISALDHLLI